MIGIIVVLLMLAIIIAYGYIFLKGRDVVTYYESNCNNSATFVNSIEELKDIIMSKGVSHIQTVNILNDTSAEIVGEYGNYKFYIQENVLKAIFPNIPLGIGRISSLVFILRINSIINRSKEIANIFKILNQENEIFSQEEKIKNEGIVSKLKVYSKIFIGAIVATVLIFAIAAVSENNNEKDYADNKYYYIGETVSMIQNDGEGEFELTFINCGTVEEYGKVSTYIEYEVKNIGDTDIYFNDKEIECYADGYSVNADFVINGNYNNNVTLSSGRNVTAEIYFDVNINNVESLQLEYADAIWVIK